MKVLYNNNLVINESARNNAQNTQAKNINTNVNFQDVLQNKINEKTPIQFSKHANMRLMARDIQLSSDQIKRVEDGVLKANEKGIQDSLVLVDNIALVVNIKNKVVITAINNDSENIFTNIDGAVIV